MSDTPQTDDALRAELAKAIKPGHGVDAHLDRLHDGRPDLFSAIPHHLCFPCCACEHNEAPREFCQRFRHYAL